MSSVDVARSATRLSRFVGIAGAILEMAWLRAPGQPIALGLIEFVRPKGQVQDLRTSNPGTCHVAFRVEDISEAIARATGQGGQAVSQPVQVTAGANKGARACYVRDPDGFTLELLQVNQ